MFSVVHAGCFSLIAQSSSTNTLQVIVAAVYPSSSERASQPDFLREIQTRKSK